MSTDPERTARKIADNVSTPTSSPSAPPINNAPAPAPDKEVDRERLRDYIIVFVAAPLTPTKASEKLTDKKPWLEFVSLLLKIALGVYALYEAVN